MFFEYKFTHNHITTLPDVQLNMLRDFLGSTEAIRTETLSSVPVGRVHIARNTLYTISTKTVISNTANTSAI